MLSVLLYITLSISDLKATCPIGGQASVNEDVFVSGTVISDWKSENIELNPSISYQEVDRTQNRATAYIQDDTGGARLVFDEAQENQLCRFDKILLNLKGCLLERNLDPDCLTVRRLSYRNVEEYNAQGSIGFEAKEKFISELTDEDIYTYVCLKDLEFIFKSGSYADIYEPYAMPGSIARDAGIEASGRMDGWASLLRDGKGRCIYMLVNSLCGWRRSGNGVPQGIGQVKGVIVHCPMRRYGGDMGRYSIRPLDEKDIVISKRGSNWKTLTAWRIDGSMSDALDFELAGQISGLNKKGNKGDRVLNDTGARAFLWTDSGLPVYVCSDVNARDASTKGYVKNGAIAFKGPSKQWFKFDGRGKVCGYNSIFIECDASKVKGEMMALNFTWCEGDNDGDKSWGFPLYWKVMCSIDGGKWTTLKQTATATPFFCLRSLPWWDKKLTGLNSSTTYRTGFDCGMGNQQRSFLLPPEAIGAKTVVIKLTPAMATLSIIRSSPSADVSEGTYSMTPSTRNISMIRFGEISIDYK